MSLLRWIRQRVLDLFFSRRAESLIDEFDNCGRGCNDAIGVIRREQDNNCSTYNVNNFFHVNKFTESLFLIQEI